MYPVYIRGIVYESNYCESMNNSLPIERKSSLIVIPNGANNFSTLKFYRRQINVCNRVCILISKRENTTAPTERYDFFRRPVSFFLFFPYFFSCIDFKNLGGRTSRQPTYLRPPISMVFSRDHVYLEKPKQKTQINASLKISKDDKWVYLTCRWIFIKSIFRLTVTNIHHFSSIQRSACKLFVDVFQWGVINVKKLIV